MPDELLEIMGVPVRVINPGFFHTLFLGLLAMLIAGASADAQARGKKQVKKQQPKPRVVKPETYAGNVRAEMFAAEMAERGLDSTWIAETMGQAQKLESVIRAVTPMPSGQRKNWQAYRDRFVEPARAKAGKEFMREHAQTLARASARFGVPVEVIVGILGVETFYGRNTGRYRVVDSLATLAFDYPVENGKDRSAYFREQLAQFFIWCARERCQPQSITGSYAGAIGLPQFMPGNIYLYGVDFDGDSHIDLHNPVDAIGSVANFLAQHGWVRYLPPVYQVDLAGAQMEILLAPDIVPTFSQWQLADLGAQALKPLPPWEKYAVVELENGDNGSDYVLGSRNFYVLTRYNRSSYYAMAVLELGRSVVNAEEVGALAVYPNKNY